MSETREASKPHSEFPALISRMVAEYAARVKYLEEQFEATQIDRDAWEGLANHYKYQRDKFEEWLRFYAPDDVDVDYMIGNQEWVSNPTKEPL